MSDDFLDPNDPLNLLISSSSETMSENSMDSPPEWPDLESMLLDTQSSSNQLQYNKFMSDEDIFSAAVDMSFDQSMAIDSHSFQFPDLGYNYLDIPNTQLVDFPFTFNSPLSDPEPTSTGTRRLSVGSASTASSLSPSPHHSAPPSSASSHASSVSPAPSINQPLPQPDLALPLPSFPLMPQVANNQALPINPAEEIARRVYQAAGVALAVPGGQLLQANGVQPNPIPANAKLPIPRLSIPDKLAKSNPSSKRSSPAGSPQPESAATPSGRPRTSHTTIERRYRTNLNSRIQSLRMAVPALRVLDKKNSAPNATAAVSINSDQSEIIDERGFIDGVKVARKCSKANVLGKAVEYIRVLKKREARLTKEQEGLKSLISGLVGGPTLLREWEREWKTLFGGPEMDEVEGEDLDGASSDEDDDDDEDGETGRKRKKTKISAPKKEKPLPIKSSTSAMDLVNGEEQPERRKRGRPRKVIPPPAKVEMVETVAPPVVAAQPSGPGQYLLAVFALFSFFNSSPSSWFSASGPYQHTGHVISSTPPPADKWGRYQPLIQTLHVLASVAVLVSILIHWLKPALGYARATIAGFKTDAAPSQPRRNVADRASLLTALAPSIRGSEDEAEALRDALGVNHGVFGIPKLSLGLGLRSLLSGKIVHVKRREESFERQSLEQRAWARLGEITVMESSTGKLSRWSTYLHMSSHVPTFSASVSDLVTLALLLYPLSASRAQTVWDRARRRALAESRAHEDIVVQNMTLEQAVHDLQSSKCKSKRTSPLVALSSIILQERIQDEAKTLFVQLVSPDITCGDEMERRKTFEAARSFGGHLADVAEALERACGGDWVALADGTIEARNEEEEDVLNILSALSLYRRIFPIGSGKPTIVLTPPPSPGREDPGRKMQLKLRRALGAEVFERRVESELDQALEEARDVVVDLLTEGKTC